MSRADIGAAADRVRRFLDAREGHFPIDVLAVVTRTGDRLLASDLRSLLKEVDPDPVVARFEGFLVDARDKAWADGYNHAKVEMLTLPTGDPAGVVADEAYRAGYEDGLRDARRGSRSSGGRRRRDALTGNWITPRPTHKPFTDDGVTYCGWATDHGVIDGCGEVWPCSTVRARTECVTCSGRGVWMDEPCPDCAPFYCYPCARGDHDEHKLAWVPDIPCECPECVPPLGGDS